MCLHDGVHRYRQFLEEICESAKADPVAGGGKDDDGAATGILVGDWSVLRCKVEEGFSRVSKVLEDGTVQVQHFALRDTDGVWKNRRASSSCVTMVALLFFTSPPSQQPPSRTSLSVSGVRWRVPYRKYVLYSSVLAIA